MARLDDIIDNLYRVVDLLQRELKRKTFPVIDVKAVGKIVEISMDVSTAILYATVLRDSLDDAWDVHEGRKSIDEFLSE